MKILLRYIFRIGYFDKLYPRKKDEHRLFYELLNSGTSVKNAIQTY